jgi:succinoglycan biosynthesis protein ExoO
MEPDVSFVIAAYNAEQSIERAIESALKQDGVRPEVIVVDDCSTDDTVQRARSFQDSRVQIHSMARNSGPGAARNSGFALARGRWIAVLDSDDVIRPDRSTRLIERAETLGAQAIVDNVEVVEEGSERGRVMFDEADLAKRARLALAEFIGSNLVFASTFNFGYLKPMFERRFLEAHQLRYDEALTIGEDYILLASTIAAGAVCAVEPKAGYLYYIRPGSVSRVLRLDHVQAMIAADVRFQRAFALKKEEAAAQARRTRSLEDAASFLSLVDNLKNRSLAAAAKVALANPRAVRHLSMPVAARLKRLLSAQ